MIHIVLYRPEKPQNTGNIMRTCVAINAKLHIIGPITFSIADKDLKRVGMDYIENLKLEYYPTLDDFLAKHKDKNLYYITRYADEPYTQKDFSNPIKDYWVMFGRESTGIPHDLLRDNEDRLLRIPMVADARSLNLSNCVAIIVYEILRQQNFLNLATSEMIKGEDFLKKEAKKNEEK